MGTVVLNGATSGSTTITPTDAVTATITLPNATATLATTKEDMEGVTAYYLPSANDGWRGLLRAGFDHWNRNQQWGGPWGGQMADAATGAIRDVEFITGFIESANLGGGTNTLGAGASTTYGAQGFKIPETQTVAAAWVPLVKTGDPTNNMTCTIYADSGGSPTGSGIANGTATAQSGKLVSSYATYGDAGWFRFVFPTPPSLTAGTQYWLVLKSSGAVDGTNYWRWPASSTGGTYPFGSDKNGNATPTWSAGGSVGRKFAIELSDSAKILQTSGTHDGKLAFGGSGASGVLGMSRGLVSTVPLVELYGDMTEFTCYRVITACSKDSTVFDIGYGENHDRAAFRCNVTTGYGSINVYESDGTLVTVTATATDLSSGTHSVGWYIRAKNDGADRIDLFIDGTTYSSATTLSISFDKALPLLGCEYVGGGFALAPTYSGSSININGFSGLPSTLGWTYSGDATEANAYSVSGGKLYQNKNGFTSAQYGVFTKAWAAANANGSNIAVKGRVVSSGNDATGSSVEIRGFDDVKRAVDVYLSEYFMYSAQLTSYPTVQYDLKSAENVIHQINKGSDSFTFINRKMAVDGSGLATIATTGNLLTIGDNYTAASGNADAIYSYWNYYTTAWSPPQFTSGSISEYINWQGNQKAMWPLLYNSGTQVSGKALMGIGQNYLDKSGKFPAIQQVDITVNASTTSTTYGEIAEAQMYAMGSEFNARYTGSAYSTTAGTGLLSTFLFDGKTEYQGTEYDTANATDTVGSTVQPVNWNASKFATLGLHKLAAGVRVSSNTGVFRKRILRVERKL